MEIPDTTVKFLYCTQSRMLSLEVRCGKLKMYTVNPKVAKNNNNNNNKSYS